MSFTLLCFPIFDAKIRLSSFTVSNWSQGKLEQLKHPRKEGNFA